MSQTIKENEIPEVGDYHEKYGEVTHVTNAFDTYVSVVYENKFSVGFLREGWDMTN